MAQIIDYDNSERMNEGEDGRAEYIFNTPVGSSGGGDPFRAYSRFPNDHVTRIEFFFDNAAGDPDARRIYKIIIEWRKEGRKQIGKGDNVNGKDTLYWEEDDIVMEWGIRSASWINGMYYESSRNPDGSNIGGKHGEMSRQNCGSGRLAGFHGRAGDRIDTIGLVFYR